MRVNPPLKFLNDNSPSSDGNKILFINMFRNVFDVNLRLAFKIRDKR